MSPVHWYIVLFSTEERPDIQTIDPEYSSQLSSVVFCIENHSVTSHKMNAFWVGPYQVLRLLTPVYYPGEEKLVSLEMLKLYTMGKT